MKVAASAKLTTVQKEAILKLWNNEYPVQLRHSDLKSFEKYLSELSDQSHLLLEDNEGQIKGWYFDFLRESERWFAMILDESVHGKGFGSLLLNRAKQYRPVLNGWVIDHKRYVKLNGKNYNSPTGFYLKNGFKIHPKSRLELAHLSAVKIKWERETH